MIRSSQHVTAYGVYVLVAEDLVYGFYVNVGMFEHEGRNRGAEGAMASQNF